MNVHLISSLVKIGETDNNQRKPTGDAGFAVDRIPPGTRICNSLSGV